jgi:hypothetical protein
MASPCTAPFMGASLGLAVALAGTGRGAGGVCGTGAGVGAALPGRQPGAGGLRAPCHAPAPGWTPAPVHGLPDVCHGGLAGLGAGQQSGINGAGALLALLVAVAMVAWALTLAGRTRVVTATVSIAALLALAWGIGPYVTQPAPLARVDRDSQLAGLGTGTGRADHGRRTPGVRRLHRRLVRDLPIQQEDHAQQRCGVMADLAVKNVVRCCAPTGPGATRRSPRRCSSWAATACPSMCCTRPVASPFCCPRS